MSAFGQVNFILKTKSVAYVVYEEPSSVDSSSRCEYLDQYPVTIRSVLDTSSGSVASASASGIESCILDQLDQHDSLLVEEDEGQINNFMQLLDMDNLDEYMEMNEREKSVVIDKPLLDVGNEEIIANDDCVEEEDSANGADVAAIEKQAFQRKQSVEEGCVLVDDQSAQWLKLDGNLLRLIDLPQLRVRVQKAAPIRKKKDNWTPSKKPKHKELGDSKSDRNRSDEGAKIPKKNKPRKEHSDGAKKEKSEKPKSGDDGPKLGKHRESSPAKKSSKDNAKKEERAQTSDVVVNVEVEPEKLKSSKESPPKKSSKEQPKKERTKSSQSIDVVVKTEPAQPDGETPSKAAKEPTTPAKDETVAFNKQPVLGQRKPVVILRRLTAKQLEELSTVRRPSASVVPTSDATRVERDRKHDKSSEEKRRREKEKRKRSKQSGDSGDAKRRKNDNGSKESEKKPEPVVVDVKKAEPVVEEEVVPVEITPMEVETPVVDGESAAKEIVPKPDLSGTLLSDDEEQRLVIDLPAEAKLEVEKPPEPVVQPEPIKPPPKQNRVVVKLDTQSAAILHDKVHDSYLLHLDVLSRVLIKLNKISIAGYRLPKPPAKVDRPKKTTEQSSRKSPVEVAAKKREEKSHAEKLRKTDLDKIDNKFLPAGSKLKSQARAKSKHESSHKKQHHHVPVPELPAELKKSHLNTSFKIPKKNAHSSKHPAAHSTAKHNRSELDCLHQEDAERERQRKRFQKEPKRPEDRHRSKKPAAAPVGEQQRSNTPDFFDPTWDDDGGGGGDASPLPEPEIQTKKPFVPGGNEKDKKTPSFRDIWNLPPEKPKVWEKDPWANNMGTIDSGEMWGAAERAQQAVPVLPLFAQESTGNQRSNTIDVGDRWSPEPGRLGRRSPNVRHFSDTIDAGECWSSGGAPPNRPNSSTERRRPKPSDKATIGDGESWSPEADTSKKITALNLDQRRRPPSRQEEMPRKQPPPRRQESSAPRGGIDTIASGDLWDTEPAGFGGKPMLPGPIWESEVKLERSKENVVPDFPSDPLIRGASHDWSENSRSNDRFRGDDRGRRRSRDRSPADRKRRRSPCWSPARGGHSQDRRPWDRDQSPGRRPSLDQRNRARNGRFDHSLDRSPPRRDSLNRSPARRPSIDQRGGGPFDRSLDRSPPRRDSPDRRRWPRGDSPRWGMSPDRRRSRSRSPERKPTRAWSPFGSGVGGGIKRRSRSRSPLRRMFGRGSSRSPDQPPRQSPVRRGAARFRSRSRSRDRHDEDQYRKRSRSPPPARHRQQYPRETSRERSREESWGRSGRSGGRDARNVFGSPPRELWNGPKEEERHRPASTDRSEPDRRQDDDETPYSPSNFLDGDEDSSSNLLLETIPLQLPLKTSPRKQLGVAQRPQSATEEPPTGEESVVQPSFRIKQEQLLMSQESTTMEEEPAASPTAEAPVNVKLENRSAEPVQPAVAEQQRPSSSANVVDPEAQEEIAPERLSALGHLKQRAERLKKLEEMKLARQKLMAQIKLQKETDKIPQVEEQPQQPVQPEPQIPKMPKVEPPSEEVVTPSVTDIKQEPHQVDPSAASLLLETAVSILSSFGHLLPSMAAGPSSAAAAPLPPLPTTPSLPPPLPAETPKPPLPDEPPPLPPATAIVPLPVWEPPGFAPMPNLGVPPPFNMQPPPAVAFEEVEQQPFQDFSMGQEHMNGGFQENSFNDWQSQGPTFNSGGGYDDQPQNFDNFDDEQSWERRQPQDVQPFNDGPDSWQQQPNYFNNPQNQQQGESLMLLPPEEIHVQRRGPPRQFDGGFGGNQGNRDPRQRFQGNNRGHNNNAFRDPRRNRGGSIYAGGGGGGFQQQQQQGQQWNRNNNKNFNRGGGQFGNHNRNRNNSWKQGNQRRGGGFKNFFPQQQQQQQQQQGDEFLIDGAGGDVSNWDDFMQ
ncbi:serine/arginine repetitive matrix protein 2-like isoform X2 [Culex pipiens pallens]|nr:serine/arginine repetitive matrix protein 2-like isoform X2 [Culex pipiens pallens]